MIRAWRRFWALSTGDRFLLVETAILLALIRIGLRTLPFTTLRRLLVSHLAPVSEPGPPRTGEDRRRPARTAGPPPAGMSVPERVAWAVGTLAHRLPGPTSCLAQALAADTLLRRRGHSPDLHLGVRGRPADDPGGLRAHAWVECGGMVVVGDLDDLPGYGVLSAPER